MTAFERPERTTPPVSLEITLAPGDVRHARLVLPHQLRQWAGQVREVLCVLDLEPSPGAPPASAAQRRELVELVDGHCSGLPHARREIVDYSAPAAAQIAAAFFDGRPVPAKTYRPGPFYAYFFALHESRHEYVLHLDSDMLFGGGSQTWVREAVALLQEREDVLACLPLSGPPTEDGLLRSQTAALERHESLAFRFDTFTTRLFLLDRRRLRERIGGLEIRGHTSLRRRVSLRQWLHGLPLLPLRDRLRPLILSTPPWDLPERLLGEAMARAGLRRIDMLGRAPGAWSLHPLTHSEQFYEALPRLIERIEQGDVPDEQRGCYDLVESMLESD